MNVNTVTSYYLSSLGITVQHNHRADIVTIERSDQDPYETPLMFPWLQSDQRLELVKALLATLLPASPDIPVPPVTTLAYEGMGQDGFSILIHKNGGVTIDFEEPYDDDAETYSTYLEPEQALTIARVISARTQQKE